MHVDEDGDVVVKAMAKCYKASATERDKGITWTKIERTTIVCCYFSPNKSQKEFKTYLNKVESIVKRKKSWPSKATSTPSGECGEQQ